MHACEEMVGLPSGQLVCHCCHINCMCAHQPGAGATVCRCSACLLCEWLILHLVVCCAYTMAHGRAVPVSEQNGGKVKLLSLSWLSLMLLCGSPAPCRLRLRSSWRSSRRSRRVPSRHWAEPRSCSQHMSAWPSSSDQAAAAVLGSSSGPAAAPAAAPAVGAAAIEMRVRVARRMGLLLLLLLGLSV